MKKSVISWFVSTGFVQDCSLLCRTFVFTRANLAEKTKIADSKYNCDKP